MKILIGLGRTSEISDRKSSLRKVRQLPTSKQDQRLKFSSALAVAVSEVEFIICTNSKPALQFAVSTIRRGKLNSQFIVTACMDFHISYCNAVHSYTVS